MHEEEQVPINRNIVLGPPTRGLLGLPDAADRWPSVVILSFVLRGKSDGQVTSHF